MRNDIDLAVIALAQRQHGAFSHRQVLDLGGGFGVPEQQWQQPLDLSRVRETLGAFRAAHPSLELWLEPGEPTPDAAVTRTARIGGAASAVLSMVVDSGVSAPVR